MTHWPATLNTVLILIAGGGLTMAGQALADRRARRRDREARRETFLMQNFVVRQEAMMKILEAMEEFSRKLDRECLHSFADSCSAYLRSSEYRESVPNIDQPKALEPSDKQSQVDEPLRFVIGAIEYHKKRKVSVYNILQKEFDMLTLTLTTNATRAGSEFVETEARNYIQAALAASTGSHDSRNDPLIAKYRLQAAINKTLNEGPLAE
jgi:hypothetical protein